MRTLIGSTAARTSKGVGAKDVGATAPNAGSSGGGGGDAIPEEIPLRGTGDGVLAEPSAPGEETMAPAQPGEFVNPKTGEINGPRGPEPTRYGDWEYKGRCSDF